MSALPPRSFEADVPAVVTLGESMAMVTPTLRQPLRTAENFSVRTGGAESTVALYLTGLGHRTAWVSAVGSDPLGSRLLDEVSRHGVDVRWVDVDPAAPTGVYFKDPGTEATTVHYYRAGSAASRMDPAVLDRVDLRGVRILHLTGITTALSEGCARLTDAAIAAARDAGALVSFDVNHRAGLWSHAEAAPELARLSAAADLVFVGRDEAEGLWGEGDAVRLHGRLGLGGTVVVKDGAVGATEFDGTTATFEPAIPVQVVEPVGAGDAFAAGYLSAMLGGQDVGGRLSCGHRTAARALGSTHDFVPA
ncbi:sugar kinase [Blastococcus saxobsidens]|uniref:2-dehydro-3-deoxygluconokinase n=1 Tax=Blastococcus saxobsidens TaxID=138336 RepID=A0A4Q7Y7B5_9ACTN|nr:sugar kinase [Blastococcus saxobsidens]RZU32103.1 2-dehydro-3-deoxygluconokinase [Blastococcus saxobsidens]